MRTLGIIGVTALVAAAALAASVPATAAGGKEVRRSGSCSASSVWKLKLKHDNGRIETEFEVDQNVNGQDWRVVLKHDGVRFFRGVRTTQAPSGSFEVRRRPQGNAGTDRIKARAVNLESGEVCKGAASI